MRSYGVGIIGCGNISAAYLRLAPTFEPIEVRAVADLNAEAARARASEFGVRVETVESLLVADDIDIVVNLTVPSAHFSVTCQSLLAGKHVYSEKPFVLSLDDGLEVQRLAAQTGLRVGSAPDTFLGGAHQQARALVDDGTMGTVTSGTAFVMGHGMEHWHPKPDFFFRPGGGPMLDMGVYYLTNLIQLLGPVRTVFARTATASATRTILSEPRRGEKIPVETPTTIHGLLEFASGAIITICTSWDVWAHGHKPMELYGTQAALEVPDPNFFGGQLRITKAHDQTQVVPTWDHPFGIANDGERANYRTAGLADMAAAIADGRPHRCSMELALHVVDVMTGLLRSGETGSTVAMATTCERPAPLMPDQARELLA